MFAPSSLFSAKENADSFGSCLYSLHVLGQSVPELTLFRQTHEVVLPVALIGAPRYPALYIYRGCCSPRRNHARERHEAERFVFREFSIRAKFVYRSSIVDATINV